MINFTWINIYDMLFGHCSIVDKLNDAYQRASGAVWLGLHRGMEFFRPIDEVGMVSREIDIPAVEAIRKQVGTFNLGGQSNSIVYLGFGRSVPATCAAIVRHAIAAHFGEVGWILPTGALEGTYEPGCLAPPEHETETQNYVAAADLVITKPGWSTIAEAMIARKPFALLYRENVHEDRTTVRAVEELGVGKGVPAPDLGVWHGADGTGETGERDARFREWVEQLLDVVRQVWVAGDTDECGSIKAHYERLPERFKGNSASTVARAILRELDRTA